MQSLANAFNKVQDSINGVGEYVQDQFAPKGAKLVDSVPGIYIKQNIELLEIASGCEFPNNYNVFQADSNGELVPGKQPMFMCKEKSNCIMRICCRGECRPFKMNLFDYELCVRGASPAPEQAWGRGNKPFKCTYLCCNRPLMEVSLVNGGAEEYIGKVVNPFTCCSLDMAIYGKNNDLQYRISGSCMQLGWLCKQCPCKPCQQMVFNIKDSNGTQVGVITKRSSGCLKACFGDVDDFSIGFPPNTSRDNKILLLFSMLLIDYQYFEENPNNNKQSSGLPNM